MRQKSRYDLPLGIAIIFLLLAIALLVFVIWVYIVQPPGKGISNQAMYVRNTILEERSGDL